MRRKGRSAKIWGFLLAYGAILHMFRCCNLAWLMQGRFSFFMTSAGEEATAVASAAALSLEDTVSSLLACMAVYALVLMAVKTNLMASDRRLKACCY